MATYSEIISKIDDAIAASLDSGGPVEVQIDDRKVKYSYDELINLRSKYSRLQSRQSRGSAFNTSSITFGSAG